LALKVLRLLKVAKPTKHAPMAEERQRSKLALKTAQNKIGYMSFIHGNEFLKERRRA